MQFENVSNFDYYLDMAINRTYIMCASVYIYRKMFSPKSPVREICMSMSMFQLHVDTDIILWPK